MTKLAILSDIHGNLPALQAVITDMPEVDHVVVAGDSINWGPFSAQVMECIFDHRWTAIRGNHEFYMLDYNSPRQPEHWTHYVAPRWLNHHLPKRWRSAIAAMPDEMQLRYADAPPVRVVHASPGTHWTGIYPTSTPDDAVRHMLATVQEHTLIAGHTHIPMQRHVDHWHILNPGSVGIPLNGDPRAQYMILEGDATGWTPEFRLVPYDREPLYAEFERIGFVDHCGATGLMMIEEIRRARPLVYAFQKWRQRVHNGIPDTMELAHEFLNQPISPQDMHPEYRTNGSLNHLVS